jgi:hypothetical protein
MLEIAGMQVMQQMRREMLDMREEIRGMRREVQDLKKAPGTTLNSKLAVGTKEAAYNTRARNQGPTLPEEIKTRLEKLSIEYLKNGGELNVCNLFNSHGLPH